MQIVKSELDILSTTTAHFELHTDVITEYSVINEGTSIHAKEEEDNAEEGKEEENDEDGKEGTEEEEEDIPYYIHPTSTTMFKKLMMPPPAFSIRYVMKHPHPFHFS